MTPEEVIIKLGLDQAGMRSGMAGADYFIQNSVKASMNSLKQLVRINFVSMAFQAVELWDKATKSIAKNYYDAMYKANELVLDKFRERFRTLVKPADESRKDIAQAERDYRFHVADADAKEEMLRSELALNRVKQENIELDLRKREEGLKTLEETFSIAKGSKAFEVLKLEALANQTVKTIELNKLKKEELDLEKQQFDLTIKREDLEKQRQEREKQKAKSFADKVEAQRKQVSEASGNLYDAQRKGNEFTLEEMGSAKFMQGTFWGNRAKWIMDLQRWSKENSMLGFHDKAEWQRNKADELFADLRKRNPYLSDPMKEVKDILVNTYVKLAEIKDEGIPIEPLP